MATSPQTDFAFLVNLLLSSAAQGDYTVGWICAISTEYVAARAFLDEEHTQPTMVSRNDSNTYTRGKIGQHNVVIAVLPDGEYGVSSAANVARDMMHSFPNIRVGLMVGVGGGVPSKSHDIRLGDIVVSAPRDGKGGVLQYDFGKTIQNQSFTRTGFLNQPPAVLRTAVAAIRSQYEIDGNSIEEDVNNILRKKPRLKRKYSRPNASSDRLYQPNVVHPMNDDRSCAEACDLDASNTVLRSQRTADDDNPAIHYGVIASGNQLMKDALIRDKLAEEESILCFEMEAAGLMNHFPCIVIRGICDYSDSHKNKDWQGYAAMAAAAYAKDLLSLIHPNNVEAEKKFVEVLSNIQQGVADVIQVQNDQVTKAILDWLTPIEYGSQHSDFLKRRAPGTGQWLLDSVEYRTWLESDKHTLFCSGIPGSGKTILTAIVINDLVARFRNNQTIGISYIYCTFKQGEEQKIENLLASLLKQLAQNRPLPEAVKDLYNQHKKFNTKPTTEEISKALRSTVALYSMVYIIVDAIDECRGYDKSQMRFLSEIFSIQSKHEVKIFATSRVMPEIMNSFKDCLHLEIRAKEEDIRTYLDHHMSPQRAVLREDPALQEEIKAKVIEVTNGMFLLAQLLSDSLMKKTRKYDILSTLERLPTGSEAYDEAYKDAMNRINDQDADGKQLAIQVLLWITCAKRALITTELQHALAVRVGESKFNAGRQPHVEDMVSVCAGLVTIDEESNVIRLVHYTTQEYFERTQKDWFPHAENLITEICITYLSFNIFESGCCQTDAEFEKRLQSNQLYDYAARNWGHHAHAASDKQLIFSFLESEMKVSASSQAMMASTRFELSRELLLIGLTSLHIAAYFGLQRITAYLLQKGHAVNDRRGDGRTPLSVAAENGHAAVIKLLLNADADIESREWRFYWTPLLRAAENGHEAAVKLLLENGADIEAKDRHYGRTPLLWATEYMHNAIIKLLLENGADIEAKDGRYGWTPLSLAAGNGHEAAVKLLLENGANIEAKDTRYSRTPLLWAVENRHNATINLLLQKGADIEAKDGCYSQTPLSWAAKNGHEAAVKLLLENGAYIEARDEQYGRTPLSWATENGHNATIKLLLENNADVKAKDETYGRTPLLWAAENGHAVAIKLLLENGADIEAMDEQHGQTPLLWAVKNRHEAAIKLLLESGADMKAKNGRTPLFWAAEKGHNATIKLLLENGADIEATDEQYGRTPLLWAADNGHQATIKLLLENGADIEAKDNQYSRTSLLWAAEKGHQAAIKLLLENGADIEAKDNQYSRTSLLLAVENRHEAAVKLLLENGADIEAKNKSNNQTPLLWAVRNRHEAVVKLLLENGANIEAKDKQYSQTPLLWAAQNGHEAVVKLLLESGADIKAKDKQYGQTPLLWAAQKGHEAAIKLLLESGADIEAKGNQYGRTPLLWAAKKGHEAAVKLLLESGADIEAKDNQYGRTPLLWAAQNGHEATIKLLLESGADIEANGNKYGLMPLLWAAKKGHEAAVKLLLESGADIEAKDNQYGRTPLSWAAERGHEAAVKLLLESGADIEAKDNQYGWTPLLWAAQNRHAAAIKLLLEYGADIEAKDKFGLTLLV